MKQFFFRLIKNDITLIIVVVLLIYPQLFAFLFKVLIGEGLGESVIELTSTEPVLYFRLFAAGVVILYLLFSHFSQTSRVNKDTDKTQD